MQPESSVMTQPSTESQQTSSPTQGKAGEGDSSTEDGSGSDSDSGSRSESDDESESELESSAGPVAPLEGSPDLPSRENLSVVQEAQVNQKQDSQKPRAASKESGTVSSSKENQVKKKATPSDSEKPEKQVSQDNKPKKPLKSLKDFPFDEIYFKSYREENDNVFRKAIADLGIKCDKGDIDHLVKIIGIAADIIRELFRGEK